MAPSMGITITDQHSTGGGCGVQAFSTISNQRAGPRVSRDRRRKRVGVCPEIEADPKRPFVPSILRSRGWRLIKRVTLTSIWPLRIQSAPQFGVMRIII
jgi:hypothetical protein